MIRFPALRKGPVRAGIAIAMAMLALLAVSSPASAGTYMTLSGSGSSWAAVALDQWARDVHAERPDGQLQRGRLGRRTRRLHAGSQVDFAASDPPFRDGEDELAGTGAESRSTATPTCPTSPAAPRSCTT